MWHYKCRLTNRVNAMIHIPELAVIPLILVKVECKCGRKQEPFRLSNKWNFRCPKCESDEIKFTTDVEYHVIQADEPENNLTEYSFSDLKTFEELQTFIIVLNQEKMKAGNKPIEPFPIRY